MIYDKQRISNALKAVKSKNTAPEILLRKALRSFGIIGYRLHWNKAPGKPDIAFPSRKIAIFVHGCFWHRCPYCKQKEPQTNVGFWNDKFRKTKERDRKTDYSRDCQLIMQLARYVLSLLRDKAPSEIE